MRKEKILNQFHELGSGSVFLSSYFWSVDRTRFFFQDFILTFMEHRSTAEAWASHVLQATETSARSLQALWCDRGVNCCSLVSGAAGNDASWLSPFAEEIIWEQTPGQGGHSLEGLQYISELLTIADAWP